jgi:hypothetical protein
MHRGVGDGCTLVWVTDAPWWGGQMHLKADGCTCVWVMDAP